jgi:hypothetical protein
MIITIAAVLMVGFITVAVVGVREAQAGVRRLEAATAGHFLENNGSTHDGWSAPVDAVEAGRFTSSLLALDKAQKQLSRNFPIPANAESSSLESVLQPLSKSPVRGS